MKTGKILITTWSLISLSVAGISSPAITSIARADMTLTFPPKSDCAFLGGDAQTRCEARRAGADSEVAKVKSGEIKTKPPLVPGSGGGFVPLSTDGMLSGYGESGTIAPTGEAAPVRSAPYNPNSIGNPWAGTPYRDGTGIPTH